MNKKLRNYIKQLRDLDQDARFNSKNKFIVYTVDATHQYRIHKLIDEYGYPTIDLIGKEGLEDFWLLVQHQDFDLDLQIACLKKCDFSPKEYMHLYDRVQVNKGLDIKYGTQFNQPIRNLEETNKLRVEKGWITVENFIKEIKDVDLELANDDKGELVVRRVVR